MTENEIKEEELAALNEAAEENGLTKSWEYFILYRKRGNPGVQVGGPFGLPHRSRKDAKLVRRQRITTYSPFEVVEFDENGDAIEDTRAHALARWLVNLDDPDWADERATVQLSDIIAKAKAILAAEE